MRLTRVFSRVRILSVLAISAATLMSVSGTAMAQPGGRGFGGGGGGGGPGGMLPAISTRQVDQFSKILGMTKDQKDQANALLEGYAQQAAAAQKTMRDASEKVRDEFRDGGDPAVWTKMRDQMTKFRDDRKKLDDGFMTDLKSVLTPQQLEKWPSVERAARRSATLRWGRISGERVDLVELAERQKYSESVMSQLTPILATYEDDLDRELVKRNEVYEGAMQNMMELFRNGDAAKAQEVVEKGREAGIRVRDVNRRYARQIEDTLPEDLKTTFATEFKKESFPDAYRKTYASRALDAAKGFKDLTPEQSEKLAELRATVDKEMDASSAKIATATEEAESKFNVQDMMQRGWRQEGPAADARKERRDLDRKALDSLKKILTEAQATRLPERDEAVDGGDGQGGPGGRGGPGRGGQGQDGAQPRQPRNRT